jgi:predicted nucleotidyltransferase/predicted DNA-binding transcriptional regulator AlpA
MSETTTDRLLGTKEAAAFYGVNVPNFVRDWASRPDFPSPVATVSGKRIWRDEDLLAYRAASGPRRGARAASLHLSPMAMKWLPVIKRRIVRGFRPERIILFGSQARGEANQYSDIDLLVVMPPMPDAKVTSRAIRAAASGVPIDTEVIVTTRGELAENIDLIGSVLRPAVREGITIYARP